MSDPVIWRGIERIIIAIGAIIFGYLGYRLYVHGVKEGSNKAEFKSTFVKFAVAGMGPGIIFMTFGAAVILIGLFTGGAHIEKKSDQQSDTWLFSKSSLDDCERLLNQPDEQIISALKTSRLPWARGLVKECNDIDNLKRIVEAICEEYK